MNNYVLAGSISSVSISRIHQDIKCPCVLSFNNGCRRCRRISNTVRADDCCYYCREGNRSEGMWSIKLITDELSEGTLFLPSSSSNRILI